MRPIVRIIMLPSGALSSRSKAVPFREEIEQAIKSISDPLGVVCLDLDGVDFLSTSFADECIGVLVRDLGYDTVVKRLRIKNGKPELVNNIAEIIKYRKEMTENQKN